MFGQYCAINLLSYPKGDLLQIIIQKYKQGVFFSLATQKNHFDKLLF